MRRRRDFAAGGIGANHYPLGLGSRQRGCLVLSRTHPNDLVTPASTLLRVPCTSEECPSRGESFSIPKFLLPRGEESSDPCNLSCYIPNLKIPKSQNSKRTCSVCMMLTALGLRAFHNLSFQIRNVQPVFSDRMHFGCAC